MRIHFVLICEGSSDEGLIPHLESLCIEAGADEVTGTAPDFRRLPEPAGRSVSEKLRATMQLEPQANLILIHRDADCRQAEPRHQEIEGAVLECKPQGEWVAVVPVQATEAWLLLDEAAIRAVAGRPNGRNDLGLPAPASVESIAQPKERLQQALIAAAEVRGRRLERLRRDFPSQRRLLLSRLTTGGPLSQVPSWLRMRAGIQQAIASLSAPRRDVGTTGTP